jgi:hypothetical protein
VSAPSETLPAPAARTGVRAAAARVWRALRFRDAVLLTALPVLGLVFVAGDSAVRYLRWLQFRDWFSFRASVPAFFYSRVEELKTLPTRVALRRGFSPEAADAGIIRLDVPRRAWDSLQGDPVGHWGEWVDATLSYGGTAIDARIRKRGDNSIHWLTEKRTITVRTPRDEFYKRYRSFGLSVKDVMSSYLANRLAPEFGLLAPGTAVVPVFLNNEFYGMFRLVEVVDESFLRPFDRMPGNIFRGDAAQRGDVYKGTQRNLFANPYIWDRVAMNDRWTSAGPGQLHLLLEDLRGGTFADHQRLIGRLDRDEWARLLGYLLVAGDPYHMDGVHNQFLYEDPSTQLLHPIPWDIRLRDVRRREAPLNDLFRAILRDPFVVDQVLREVKAALDGRSLERTADSLVRAVDARYGAFLAYDRSRRGLVPDVGTAEEAIAFIRDNAAELRRSMARDTVAFRATAAAGLTVLDFETRGLVGADLVALEGAAGPGLRLFRDRNRNGLLDRDDPEVAVRADSGRLALARALPLLAGWSTAEWGVDPGRVAYRLFLTGSRPGTPRPRLANRVTGGEAAVVEWEAGALIGAAAGWHPWRYPEPAGRVHRLSGLVRLAETLRIPAEDTLIIEPGARLELGADVSIISRGPVRAIGTRERPIRVLPSTAGRPWGTFALQGPAASGSVVRNVEFAEGGGALVDRIEYIGMVNVHRAAGVVFDSVLFRENRRSDDTFHALHAGVDLTNSRFVRANSDAVDYDVSSGAIHGNRFERSGGDAIDLMTSTPSIIGNRIRDAGDKGISIGEASAPFIFDNLIEDVAVGIEIKDRSAPVILGNEVRRAGVGLRSRLKNWRYGGSGFGMVVNTAFRESRQRIDADSLSRLTTAGVVGLDSADAGSAPTPAAWLYGARGIGLEGAPRIGLPGPWHAVAPRRAIASFRFEDDFGEVADGWRAGGRVTRLEKRRDVLVVGAEGGTATVHREVSWDLGATDGGVLVLEVAGRDVRSGRVVVEGERGAPARELAVAADPSRFTLIELPLPPDRYRRVAIEVEPTPGLSHIQRATGLSVIRAGRFDLRSLALYPGNGPAALAARAAR